MLDTGENSEAPPPREMFDLEVKFYCSKPIGNNSGNI